MCRLIFDNRSVPGHLKNLIYIFFIIGGLPVAAEPFCCWKLVVA